MRALLDKAKTDAAEIDKTIDEMRERQTLADLKANNEKKQMMAEAATRKLAERSAASSKAAKVKAAFNEAELAAASQAAEEEAAASQAAASKAAELFEADAALQRLKLAAESDALKSINYRPISPTLTAVAEEDILECQKSWAGAIAATSAIYAEGGDYIQAAADAANELYGYGHTKVLFKPTKAAEFPFRSKSSEAMSYFVGGNVIDGGYDEDAGFAINGGNGWESVEFFNHGIDLHGLTATAMGYYVFTDATTKAKVRVEYTFGYKRCSDGKVRIYLHHSSVPYSAAPAVSAAEGTLAPLTEKDVSQCQAKWANAIETISKTYLEKGDYIKAAGAAAGELYGYGHSQVLFKPTKAAVVPFRPSGKEAMSYFVGGNVVENGYPEDGGFAINNGKGWKDIVFTNHGTELLGSSAIAMGSYEFTCATTNEKSRVEYTFGYKRNEDGKPRIFLHHSSVPYKV